MSHSFQIIAGAILSRSRFVMRGHPAPRNARQGLYKLRRAIFYCASHFLFARLALCLRGRPRFERWCCFSCVGFFVVSFLVSLPAFACPSASSPVPCPAPFVSWVVPCARAVGASFVSLRPSSRSFSRWVVVSFFPSRAAAGSFAGRVASLLPGSSFSCGASFVVVRRCGAWWCASVPVSVVWGSVPASSCPVFFAPVVGG